MLSINCQRVSKVVQGVDHVIAAMLPATDVDGLNEGFDSN
jgi:hypothetical protein